ncbi:HAD-like domain-containing protein [Multifurca ochricompacta]|uniref:HAD-like domain-containing protein n=1 Tax=Multifurca ochricompacta TaxID=376703 RepID=A0AAD4M6R3_9AGAM|nr:HAD-like domain-containing protein [Multifurca ochricompacta]
MLLFPRRRILVFDLGDVLFSWSPATSTSIPPKRFKAMVSSTIWQQYERGTLSEDECYRLIGQKYTLDPDEFRQATADVRATLRPDYGFFRFIRELQTEAKGTLRIFLMSNISAPDFAATRAISADWGIFERIFISPTAGMRKPDLCFFKYVLDEIKAEPSSVVFVDDRFENVLAARSLGINGVVFDDVRRVRQALRYYVGDPIIRGRAFLEANAGHLESETSLGHCVAENFVQLLILEATNERKLVNYVHHPYTWGFFKEKPTFVRGTGELPHDLDTTSIGLMVTQPDDRVFNAVMDKILQYQNLFDLEKPCTDPVVALNVLSLFYSRGRGHELRVNLEWIRGVLEHRAYLDGTFHYVTAECFLFFTSRLLRSTSDASLHAQLTPLLRERVIERVGTPGDAMALSMRVLAGAVVGVRAERDLAALLPLQCEDGGWDASWVFKYGSSGIKIGNRGLTTAFALNAIAALQQEAVTSNGNRTLVDSGKPKVPHARDVTMTSAVAVNAHEC